jgi:hypothetical protein
MAPPASEPSCKAALRPRGIRQILGAFLRVGVPRVSNEKILDGSLVISIALFVLYVTVLHRVIPSRAPVWKRAGGQGDVLDDGRVRRVRTLPRNSQACQAVWRRQWHGPAHCEG